TTWGSREGADVSDTDRMKEKPDYELLPAAYPYSKAQLLECPNNNNHTNTN
ncbi:hypothetical protein LOZ18_006825, partial [Ophidiomyces ophidiicola]